MEPIIVTFFLRVEKMSRGETQEDGARGRGVQEIPAQISKQTTLTSGEEDKNYKYSVQKI